VNDGRVAIDDNRAEGQMHAVAVGRKNSLFDVRPFDYLTDVLSASRRIRRC
jgi:Transposase IS66 family